MTFRHLMLLLMPAVAAMAQSTTTIPADSSGNGMLNGNYYFRHVVYSADSTTGNIQRATAIYGVLTFNGSGSYTVNAMMADSQTNSGQPAAYTAGGQTLSYAIGSNGQGYMDNPWITGEYVVGLVSKGVFVGSSTEGQTNDVLFAVPVSSTAATNATLNGTYQVAYMNLPAGDPTKGSDALFQMTANGNGGFTGTISASGYAGSSSTTATQSISGASYSFSNGVAALTMPSTGTLISGTKVMYVSADGNFLIGGSGSGYDLFAAVKSTTGGATSANYAGLYYTAGLEEDFSSSGFSGLETHYGSFIATSGTIIRHDRLAPFNGYAYNQTYDDYCNLASDGTCVGLSPFFTDFKYAVGTGGIGVVGIGVGPFPGIIFGVQAPAFTGSGVYLNPTGVLNAASFAPFTAGVAPGEWISLFGTNLAPNTVTASTTPFPTTLGGVSVSINGRPAPLAFVSPGQINAIVPWATELTFAQITVTNNNKTSNMVELFVNDTLPGVYTQSSNGVGPASVTHANYQLVTASNPAKVGETLLVYLTGLGSVNPAVADGAVGPTNPLSVVTGDIEVYIDGNEATVTYAGLAPGLAGYQLNVVVPSGVSSGDVYLDISTTDAYVSQSTIHVQ